MPTTEDRCEITSATQAFEAPLAVNGKRFCGLVLAVHQGRNLELYSPDMPLPEDRYDLVIVPTTDTSEGIIRQIPDGGTARLYVEGSLEVDPACFDGSGTACLPYRRPIEIDISDYRIRP